MRLASTAHAADGALRTIAKFGVEQALWTRARRNVRRLGTGVPGRLPTVEPTAVLQDDAEWQAAVAHARVLGLPLHRDLPKNWDTLGAASTVLARVGPTGRVLDAGAARYSTLLIWLYQYRLRDLVGINLEFRRTVRHGRGGCVRFEPGDATATRFDAGSFDAVTCLSVIEHGVPIPEFLAEAARLLRPGGVLVVSTDYDADPPDTTGHTAYGAPVHVFSTTEIESLIRLAGVAGFDLDGTFAPQHRERPVHWKRLDLRFTFVRLTFTRRAT
jgi:2-polyprenyl-3-methyl-5-hydroxy-6-metoxy-1,4-benzoquinol methylase